jgi:hypothetical protein
VRQLRYRTIADEPNYLKLVIQTQKRRGDFSFEISPPLSEFSKIWFGARSQLIVTSESSGTCERSPRFPYSSVFTFAVRAFLVSIQSSQFPDCFVRPVAGSPSSSVPGSLASSAPGSLPIFCSWFPCGFRSQSVVMALSTLSYWKISPPLIRKILVISLKCIGFETYFFVEIARVVWKFGPSLLAITHTMKWSRRRSRGCP